MGMEYKNSSENRVRIKYSRIAHTQCNLKIAVGVMARSPKRISHAMKTPVSTNTKTKHCEGMSVG
jgi:regulation of enolase protein 1 (concanavalin A-like superfamily)